MWTEGMRKETRTMNNSATLKLREGGGGSLSVLNRVKEGQEKCPSSTGMI
jgi:hypothetical protein